MATVDENTKKIVSELLDEKLQEIPRKKDVLTSETAVPIKITIGQGVAILVFCVSVIVGIFGGIWWLAERESSFRMEIVNLRIEFKDEIIVLRKDMNAMLKTLKDDNSRDISYLKTTVAELKAQVPLIQASCDKSISGIERRVTVLEGHSGD